MSNLGNIQVAAANGNLELFKNLLKSENIDILYECDNTIGWAIASGQSEILRYILNITGINTPTYKMEELIELTIYAGLLDVSKVLLEHKEVQEFIETNYEDVVDKLKKYVETFKLVKNNQYSEVLDYIITNQKNILSKL